MKIGFIHDRLELYPKPAGGKERFVLNLAKQLSKYKDVKEIIILTLSANIKGNYKKLGKKILIKKVDNSSIFREIFRLYESCDVININTCNFVVPLLNNVKSKTVYHLHDLFIGIKNEGRHLDKAISQNWDLIVCPSRFSKNYLDNYYKYLNISRKSKIIPRGINLSIFNQKISKKITIRKDFFPSYLNKEILKINNSYPLIIFPHRSYSKKGEDYLNNLAKKMKGDYPNLGIILTSPELSSEEDYKLLRKKYEKEIILLNWQTDKTLSLLLRKSNLMILLSTNPESFSQISLESIACGTPVVATKYGNLLDLSKEFQGMFLVDKQEESIISGIKRSLEYSDSQKKMDKDIILKKYSIGQMGMNYLNLYNSIKKSKPNSINKKLLLKNRLIQSPFSYLSGNKIFLSDGENSFYKTYSQEYRDIYKLLSNPHTSNELLRNSKLNIKKLNTIVLNLIKDKVILEI